MSKEQSVVTWRHATITLGSILLTGLTAWFAFGHDKISRGDAEEIVKHSAITREGGAVTRSEVVELLKNEMRLVATEIKHSRDTLKRIEGAVETNRKVLLDLQIKIRQDGAGDENNRTNTPGSH